MTTEEGEVWAIKLVYPRHPSLKCLYQPTSPGKEHCSHAF